MIRWSAWVGQGWHKVGRSSINDGKQQHGQCEHMDGRLLIVFIDCINKLLEKYRK